MPSFRSLFFGSWLPRRDVYRNKQDIFSPDLNLKTHRHNKSEIPIGKTVSMMGITYVVQKAEKKANCCSCDLLKNGICQKTKKYPCSAYSRSDQTWIIFKKKDDEPSNQ